MNISILIPCYNWDVFHFIKSLHSVCKQTSLLKNFEIICIEDGSTNCFNNKRLKKIQNVQYEIHRNNIGRSAIRNLLAKKANYDWVLFIDCDSKIFSGDFITNYIENIEKPKPEKYIYYGETIYEKIKTKNRLHQKYGERIESKRKKEVFSSHHFLMHKNEFQKTQFDENIKFYGYEDVLFELKYTQSKHERPTRHKYKFKYINNPLYHIGLKSNRKFMTDCESGLKNLVEYHNDKNIIKKIKVLKYWKYFSKIGLIKLIMICFKILKNPILKNLHSNNPSLLLLQFYKLGFFSTLKFHSGKNR